MLFADVVGVLDGGGLSNGMIKIRDSTDYKL